MALIIKPNSGINNAVAGLAAGFGQGMQLGMESQKIQLAREKQEAELRFAEQRAALELAAEERAKTTFGQQQELFDQAQAERAAGKEAMGLFGQAADLRGQIQGGVANMPGMPAELQYQPSNQSGPQQSNMYTGAPQNPYAAFNSMMGKLAKKEQYATVTANYDKAMQQAGALAGKMSLEMADRYLKEVERRNLLVADDQARQAFADHIANVESSGGLALLDPMGNRVKDPQMDATVRSLVEQSGNRNVNLSKLQEQFDTLLGKVNANNTKARTTQFELGTIEQSILTATQAGNGGAVAALEEARGAVATNPYLSEKDKADLLSNAKNGRVPVLINGKQEWVSAVNKAEETAKLQSYADKMKELEQQLKEAQVEKTKAEGGYLNRRDTGMTLENAQRNAIYLYNKLTDDERYELQQQGITPEEYVNRVTHNFMSQGGGTGQGGTAAMGQATGQVPQVPALPGQRSVTLQGRGFQITPEIANALKREADALGIAAEGDQRRKYAAWRMQNPDADPNDFGKAMNRERVVTPKEKSVVAGQGVSQDFVPTRGPDGKYPAWIAPYVNLDGSIDKEKYLADSEERIRRSKIAPITDESLRASKEALGLNESLSSLKPKGAKSIGEYRKEIEGIDFNKIANADDADRAIEQIKDIDKIYKVGAGNLIQRLERMKDQGVYPAEAMTRDQLEAERKKQYERGYAQGKVKDTKKPTQSGSNAGDGSFTPSGEPTSFEERIKIQAANAQRVLKMSETELKNELVNAYGFDTRDIREFMAQYGSEEIKAALAQIGPQSAGVGPAPKNEQATKNSRATFNARQTQLRTQMRNRTR